MYANHRHAPFDLGEFLRLCLILPHRRKNVTQNPTSTAPFLRGEKTKLEEKSGCVDERRLREEGLRTSEFEISPLLSLSNHGDASEMTHSYRSVSRYSRRGAPGAFLLVPLFVPRASASSEPPPPGDRRLESALFSFFLVLVGFFPGVFVGVSETIFNIYRDNEASQ